MAEDDFEFYNKLNNKPVRKEEETKVIISSVPKVSSKVPRHQKSKIKLAFRISAFSLAALLTATGGIAVKRFILKGYVPDNFNAKGCYISLDESFNVEKYNESSYDFAMLNLPNWESELPDKLINNLKICSDNNIPTGVCLNSNAETNLQAETEALRLLSIIEDANIKLPIIINISDIEKQNTESSLLTIINTLKEKGISPDKILISGDNEKLNSLSSQFDSYSKYILSNREKITGNEYAGGNFNTGAVINDVNAYLEEDYLPQTTVAVAETKNNDQCLGVDVSSYQGNIDWETAKNYIDFAIIRVANFNAQESVIDSKCQYNISECKRLGIPFGIYVFSTATTKEEANTECTYLFNQLSELGITKEDMVYPIYIDIETKSQEAKLVNHDLTMVDAIEAFCQNVDNNGYKAGIYINQSMAKLLDYTDTENKLDNYHRWIANYGDNNGYKPFNINELDNYNQANVTVQYDMHQITDQMVIPGIGKDVDPYANTTVDCNIDVSGLAFSDNKTLG